ncbi:hypothetical protein CLAM6_27560 [Cobetia sp. AM6]|nr:hypothetical protein CLAM6_27560 [Cobetia sp. AM6]
MDKSNYMDIYNVGDLIDQRFKVTGVCSNAGGMGQVLFVDDESGTLQGELALKYCKSDNEEYKTRFRREVRLLEEFVGNPRVVNILSSNVDFEVPYFVMPYYSQGDLYSNIDLIVGKHEVQDIVFMKMIDSLSQLHEKNIYHRDIKPQNFLMNGEEILVSDFGLGLEPSSETRITSSAMFAGTHGYLPPEFRNGGFKRASEASDIFMLGKSFYVLMTNQDPTYIMDGAIHPAMKYVIDRACHLDANKRYQNLSELKQSIKQAYDVILNRGGELGVANQLLSTICDRLDNESKYSPPDVIRFIENLALTEEQDKVRVCQEIPDKFFRICGQDKIIPHVPSLIESYRCMVESNNYSFAFAESIARRMKLIFDMPVISCETRVLSLELAIDAAYRMNRYVAMDTCAVMIKSVKDANLAIHVAAIMDRNKHDFITSIEPSQCNSGPIMDFLKAS